MVRHEWTDEEREWALNSSTPGEVEEVAERVGVSVTAVKSMRGRLRRQRKLVTPYHEWTGEEDRLLLSASSNAAVERVAERVGVSLYAAKIRRVRLRKMLGISTPRHRWSVDEVEAVQACGSLLEVQRWCDEHGLSFSTAEKLWLSG